MEVAGGTAYFLISFPSLFSTDLSFSVMRFGLPGLSSMDIDVIILGEFFIASWRDGLFPNLFAQSFFN